MPLDRPADTSFGGFAHGGEGEHVFGPCRTVPELINCTNPQAIELTIRAGWIKHHVASREFFGLDAEVQAGVLGMIGAELEREAGPSLEMVADSYQDDPSGGKQQRRPRPSKMHSIQATWELEQHGGSGMVWKGSLQSRMLCDGSIPALIALITVADELPAREAAIRIILFLSGVDGFSSVCETRVVVDRCLRRGTEWDVVYPRLEPKGGSDLTETEAALRLAPVTIFVPLYHDDVELLIKLSHVTTGIFWASHARSSLEAPREGSRWLCDHSVLRSLSPEEIDRLRALCAALQDALGRLMAKEGIERCLCDLEAQRVRNNRKGVQEAEKGLASAIETEEETRRSGGAGLVPEGGFRHVIRLPGGGTSDSCFRAEQVSRLLKLAPCVLKGSLFEAQENNPEALSRLTAPSRPEEALALVLGSRRCMEELHELRQIDYRSAWPEVPGSGGRTGMAATKLALQGWRRIPRWAEFRLFISHGHLTCACQRFQNAYEPRLHREKESLIFVLQDWYLEKVMPRLYSYATEDAIIDVAMMPDHFGRYAMEKGAAPREPFTILALRRSELSQGGIFFDVANPKDRLLLSYGPFELRLAHAPRSHLTENERNFKTALLNGYQGRLEFNEELGRYIS